MQKRKEYCRYGQEGKLSEDEVQHVCRRTDVVSYALMAEMSHFQKERVADFTEAMRGFLRNQVSFYRNVSHGIPKTGDMCYELWCLYIVRGWRRLTAELA